MIALLDVNMLVALMDPKHIHHGKARSWWATQRAGLKTGDKTVGWASCAITQNGFLRIVTLAAYPNRFQLADALAILRQATALPGHVFWPEDVSLLDAAVFDHSRLLGPRQITDIYLLATAVRHGGRLVTLDTGITTLAVRGAKAQHLVTV
jgi:uncharacterized protein